MRRLWMRFLDWFWMRRYYVSYDLAHGDDYGCAVIVKAERDGSFTVVDVAYDKASDD